MLSPIPCDKQDLWKQFVILEKKVIGFEKNHGEFLDDKDLKKLNCDINELDNFNNFGPQIDPSVPTHAIKAFI